MLKKDRSHTLSATKGSLHLFGSSEFVQQFQGHWQREGYCDYTQPPQAVSLSGTHVSVYIVYVCGYCVYSVCICVSM